MDVGDEATGGTAAAETDGAGEVLLEGIEGSKGKSFSPTDDCDGARGFAVPFITSEKR